MSAQKPQGATEGKPKAPRPKRTAKRRRKGTGRPRGRPSVIAPSKTKRLCELMAQGVPATVAVKLVGMTAANYTQWRARGKAKKSKAYEQFLHDTEEAKAKHEATLVLLIQQGAQDKKMGPEHAKWLLERRYAKRWSMKNRSSMEVSGKDGGPILYADVDMDQLSNEELQRIKRGDASFLAGKGGA